MTIDRKRNEVVTWAENLILDEQRAASDFKMSDG